MTQFEHVFVSTLHSGVANTTRIEVSEQSTLKFQTKENKQDYWLIVPLDTFRLVSI